MSVDFEWRYRFDSKKRNRSLPNSRFKPTLPRPFGRSNCTRPRWPLNNLDNIRRSRYEWPPSHQHCGLADTSHLALMIQLSTASRIDATLQAHWAQRGEINRRRLGRWIARHQGRIVDGLRFERASGTTSAERWQVKPVTSVSSFTLVSPPELAQSVNEICEVEL